MRSELRGYGVTGLAGVLSQCPELAPSISATIASEMTEERSLQECWGQCPALTHANRWLIAHATISGILGFLKISDIYNGTGRYILGPP
jgi:hypothetical protein